MREKRLRRIRERPASDDWGMTRKSKLAQKWKLSHFEDPRDVFLRAKLEKGQLRSE